MLTTDECLNWMKSEVPEALLADKQLAEINKAGIVPLVEDPKSGATQILLIKPRPKKKHLGDVKWQLIKGTRMVKPANKDWRDYKLGEPLDGTMQLEPLLCAALREGNEEAGLIFDNISAMGVLGPYSFKSKTTGNSKQMQLYALLMKDAKKFDWPGKQHQFTQAMQWFPIHALPQDMREDAREIIDQIKEKL